MSAAVWELARATSEGRMTAIREGELREDWPERVAETTT